MNEKKTDLSINGQEPNRAMNQTNYNEDGTNKKERRNWTYFQIAIEIENRNMSYAESKSEQHS